MTPFERIKETAQSHGMSLQDTAKRAGIGINTIYGWKRYIPASDKLQAVADALGVSTDYLLGNTDAPLPASAGQVTIDLTKSNTFSYRGDQVDTDGIDPDDWEIIKAVLARAKKDRQEREGK